MIPVTDGLLGRMVRAIVDEVEYRDTGVAPGAGSIDREGALALVEALLDRVRRELAEAERM